MRFRRRVMMGRQSGDQTSFFYEFRLDDRVPKNHLLRRINVFVTAALADVQEQLDPYYSEIGRPSVDPELMIRMLIVGYCYGLRSERKLTQEVELHLAYRWFCRLDLNDKVPHHSTFSENRLHRFRESDVFRHLFARREPSYACGAMLCSMLVIRSISSLGAARERRDVQYVGE